MQKHRHVKAKKIPQIKNKRPLHKIDLADFFIINHFKIDIIYGKN